MIIDRIGKHNLVRKACEVCGCIFHVRKYRALSARFCSQVCGGSWHATTRLAHMPKPYMVGNQFRKGLSPGNKGIPGPRGENNPNWKPRTIRTCEHCGESFSRPIWVEKQNGPQRFCSRECFANSGVFVGESSPCWVGGPQTSRGRSWPSARARVVREQEGACARCNALVGKSLAVHHIRPFRLFASSDEANVRTNLIGLCQSCHMIVETESSERACRRIEQAQRQTDLFIHPADPERGYQQAALSLHDVEDRAP